MCGGCVEGVQRMCVNHQVVWEASIACDNYSSACLPLPTPHNVQLSAPRQESGIVVPNVL